MSLSSPNCAECTFKVDTRICKVENGKHPDSCPTVATESQNEDTNIEYTIKENQLFARNASLQEKEGYTQKNQGYEKIRPVKTRLEETLDFISRMGYQKIGMAFCIGLRKEAAIVGKILKERELNLISAICKVGRVPKEKLGLSTKDTLSGAHSETMCNPILQAEILNREKTEFNILLGLCVGHDSLFLKYADAPCTVFAVKDRVTGHNPLAAIYTLDSYYRGLK